MDIFFACCAFHVFFNAKIQGRDSLDTVPLKVGENEEGRSVEEEEEDEEEEVDMDNILAEDAWRELGETPQVFN